MNNSSPVVVVLCYSTPRGTDENSRTIVLMRRKGQTMLPAAAIPEEEVNPLDSLPEIFHQCTGEALPVRWGKSTNSIQPRLFFPTDVRCMFLSLSVRSGIGFKMQNFDCVFRYGNCTPRVNYGYQTGSLPCLIVCRKLSDAVEILISPPPTHFLHFLKTGVRYYVTNPRPGFFKWIIFYYESNRKIPQRHRR